MRKTYFVKNWLAEFDKSNKLPANENSIELKPIYISLFGMREISDIKSAIDRCVNPFFYSKTGKILKIAGRIASKIIFKTELDIDKDGKMKHHSLERWILYPFLRMIIKMKLRV